MVPWQERTWKAHILGQFAPYGKLAGGPGGGTVTPEEKTYIKRWTCRAAAGLSRLNASVT